MLFDMIASEVYLVQAALFRDWGYNTIAEHLQHEADHERLHTQMQIDRLLYLGAKIDLNQKPIARTGDSPLSCLEIGLEMETLVAQKLNELIALCNAAADSGTRSLGDELLHDTEMDHILWLETQLRLIKQVGENRYLAEQIGSISA
jgi:bacterioferritin